MPTKVVKISFLTRKIVWFYELVQVIVLNRLINSKSDEIAVKSYKNVEIGWKRLKSRFWTLFYVFKRNIYIYIYIYTVVCTTVSQ
jgi:hypothetical protein